VIEAGAWRRDGIRLVRELGFRDFEEALAFVERLGARAVDHGRRPDLCIVDHNRVRLTIANQHGGPLTPAEQRLAEKVDGVIADA
jgi:pterin-4a-carbinolamine dehydratase